MKSIFFYCVILITFGSNIYSTTEQVINEEYESTTSDSFLLGEQYEQQILQPSINHAKSADEKIDSLNYTDIINPDISIDYMGLMRNNTSANRQNTNNYWGLLLLAFPILALFGNMLVVLSVIREKNLHSVTNYLVCSLASSDLFVAAVVMPMAVYAIVSKVWSLPILACDLWIASDVFGSTASIYNLVAIAVDRYIAVTQPLKYAQHQKNSNRIYYMIAAIYIISTLVATPMAVGLNNTPNRMRDACSFNNSTFLIISSMLSFYIPTLMMLGLYFKVFRLIRTRTKNTFGQNKLVLQLKKLSTKRKNNTTSKTPTNLSLPPNDNNNNNNSLTECDAPHADMPQVNSEPEVSVALMANNKPEENVEHNEGRRKSLFKTVKNNIQANNSKYHKKQSTATTFASKKEKKVTKTLAIVLIVYLVCWLPFFVANLTSGICNKLNNYYDIDCTFINEDLITVLTFLGYLNSVLNPIIYTIFNIEFRKAFKNILSELYCCKK